MKDSLRPAFIRGPFLNPFELQSYEPFASANPFVAIGSRWQFYPYPFSFKGMDRRSAGAWGDSLGKYSSAAAATFNRALSWSAGQSYGLRNLEELTSDCSLLHTVETHF